jgi:hypothetical protein
LDSISLPFLLVEERKTLAHPGRFQALLSDESSRGGDIYRSGLLVEA